MGDFSDSEIIEAAKRDGWYLGEADFGHGFKWGWCKGPFAQNGFVKTDQELVALMRSDDRFKFPPPGNVS